MKKIVFVCVILLFSALLLSCVEIQVSDVGRIHIKNLEVPEIILVDDEINLEDVEVWVFYKNNTSDSNPDEKLSISNADIELSGSGAPSEGTTLLVTNTAQEYTLKITYGGVSVTISYHVLGSSFVSVGSAGTSYTIPTGYNNSGTVQVNGGYLMATTETTYDLWYKVYTWATDDARGENQYSFQNAGQEGNDGIPGAAPTSAKYEPVTMVSWRDVIIWLNAFSEMSGLDPVYYEDGGGDILRDSTAAEVCFEDPLFGVEICGPGESDVDDAVQMSNEGYRLPSADEWEMAARWIDGTEWTLGSYASGATANVNNEEATRAVAWYSYGSNDPNNFTRPVGQLLDNALGIYDMSGNVWEWCFDGEFYPLGGEGKYSSGGSYITINAGIGNEGFLQIGLRSFLPSTESGQAPPNESSLGFRIVKNGS